MAIEQVKPAPGEAKPGLQMENIDVAEVGETFADSVRDMSFDGQTFRLELCVTRMEAPADAQSPRRARRYTACRIVLPTTAALDLAQKLGRVLTVVMKQNMAKAAVDAPAAKSA